MFYRQLYLKLFLKVAVAINGETAIKQVQYHNPELILLEVMMPDMNGYETCKRIRSSPRTSDIPIIFMTALSDVKHKVRGFALGAVDYLTKPIPPEEVLAKVQLQLQLYDRTRILEEQNRMLKNEILQREKAEGSLLKLNQELENKIEERTNKLSETLKTLRQVQVKLSQLKQDFEIKVNE